MADVSPSLVHPYPEVAWDDLRMPATVVNPVGLAGDPDIDTTDGTLLFDKSATEIIFLLVQMPHGWKQGTDLHPHIHWSPTDAGDSGTVHWQVSYQLAEINGTFSGSWTDIDCTDNAESTAEQHLLGNCSEQVIDMGSVDTVSAMLKMKVARIGGTADTYDNDARLLEFDIHYQIDAAGSRKEYVK